MLTRQVKGEMGQFSGWFKKRLAKTFTPMILHNFRTMGSLSRAFYEKYGDERNAAMGYYRYAGLYEMRNDWEEALECCERSLEMFETIGDILWIATLHSELAFIKTFLRRPDEALEHFNIGIEIFKKTHLNNELVEA